MPILSIDQLEMPFRPAHYFPLEHIAQGDLITGWKSYLSVTAGDRLVSQRPVPGVRRPVLYFDGQAGSLTGGIVQFDSVLRLNVVASNVTVAFWHMMPDATFMSNGSATPRLFHFQADAPIMVSKPPGSALALNNSSVSILAPTASLVNNQLAHWVVTGSTTTIVWYKNGVIITPNQGDPGVGTDTTNMIGARTSGNFYYQGFIANLMFFNQILTATQVASLYAAELVNFFMAGEGEMPELRAAVAAYFPFTRVRNYISVRR